MKTFIFDILFYCVCFVIYDIVYLVILQKPTPGINYPINLQDSYYWKYFFIRLLVVSIICMILK